MEIAIEILAIITFAVIGLSHIVRHRAWAEFFADLHGRGRAGAFLNGFLALVPGAIIVAFHNVWTGIPAVLTVLGWSFVLKGAIIFLFPDLGLRSMATARPERSKLFAIPGAFLLIVSGLLAYSVWRGISPW